MKYTHIYIYFEIGPICIGNFVPIRCVLGVFLNLESLECLVYFTSCNLVHARAGIWQKFYVRNIAT